MIKITEEIVDLLSKIPGVGYFCEDGAVIGDSEFIIYVFNGFHLAHISEFEQTGIDGMFIRLKEK